MQNECSDCIIIPKKVYQDLGFTNGFIIIQITNEIGTNVVGTLRSIHDMNDDVIYMPNWMIHHLGILTNLTISCPIFKQCTRIRFRPHQVEFIQRPEWNILLPQALQFYHTLQKGAKVPFYVDRKYMFFTVELLNEGDTHIIELNNGSEIEVEIMKSVDQLTNDEVPYLFYNPRKCKIHCIPFTGKGYTIGSNSESPSSLKDAIQKRYG